jgi:hypothetical protein
MLVNVNRDQARAILCAMRQVAMTGNRNHLTDAAHRAITSASQVVSHAPEIAAEGHTTPTPHDLACILADNVQAMWAARFLAVIALVDGVLDKEKIALVLQYAAALDVNEAYLTQLSQAVSGNLPWCSQT